MQSYILGTPVPRGSYSSSDTSLLVMALQRPEPKAAWASTKFMMGLQIVLTTVQAALLVPAIRRKFYNSCFLGVP